MMWVATVTLRDKKGDALQTIRYGAMPDDGCGSLLHGAAGDVNELLRKLPRLKLCLLSDGARALRRDEVGNPGVVQQTDTGSMRFSARRTG